VQEPGHLARRQEDTVLESLDAHETEARAVGADQTLERRLRSRVPTLGPAPASLAI